MTPFVCPHCKKPSEADERVTGDVVTCPACGRRLQLPSAPPMAIPVSPASGSVGIPDEDPAALRAALPADYPAAAGELGAPRYRTESRAWTGNETKPAIAFVGVGLALLAFSLFCVWRINAYFFHREENFPPGAGFPWINVWMGLVMAAGGLGLCWFGVRIVVKAVREVRAYAVVYPGGFVYFDGAKYSVWRWADIAAMNAQHVDQRTLGPLFIETSRLLTKYYRLRHRDGTSYQFWSTQGSRAAQFGHQAEQETYRVMMPDAAARLARGEAVQFGPFEMKASGLAYGGQFTPWSEVGPARFENGRLSLGGIGPAKSTAQVLLKQIDNSHVFLPLLEQKVGFERGA